MRTPASHRTPRAMNGTPLAITQGGKPYPLPDPTMRGVVPLINQ
jgi:hypothetical protein